MSESRSSHFTWDDAAGVTVTPSRDDERYYLAIAAIGALKKTDGIVQVIQDMGLINDDGSITDAGKKRLKELIAL